MKNLKKFEISKEKQKETKGGHMQPDPVANCCNYRYLDGGAFVCMEWSDPGKRCY